VASTWRPARSAGALLRSDHTEDGAKGGAYGSAFSCARSWSAATQLRFSRWGEIVESVLDAVHRDADLSALRRFLAMMRSTVSARSLMLLPGTISAVRWCCDSRTRGWPTCVLPAQSTLFDSGDAPPAPGIDPHTLPCWVQVLTVFPSPPPLGIESRSDPKADVASTSTNALGLRRPLRPVRPGGTEEFSQRFRGVVRNPPLTPRSRPQTSFRERGRPRP
jgi:hypothetical protein